MTLITWEDTFKQIDDKVKAFKTMADISAAALKEALRQCDEKDAEIAKLKAVIQEYRDAETSTKQQRACEQMEEWYEAER